MIAAASLPPYAEVLGPVPVTARPAAPADGRHPAADGQPSRPAPGDAQVRALIRVPRKDGAALAASLHAAQSLRSARKDTEVIRVQLDPAELI
jgi:primosomal protein N' (replication factor Y)